MKPVAAPRRSQPNRVTVTVVPIATYCRSVAASRGRPRRGRRLPPGEASRASSRACSPGRAGPGSRPRSSRPSQSVSPAQPPRGAPPRRWPAQPSAFVTSIHPNRMTGWTFTIAPAAVDSPSQAGRSSPRQPIAKQKVEDRADLSELEPVQEREADRCERHDRPADQVPNREDRRCDKEARDPARGARPSYPERIREQRERDRCDDERGWVEIDGEPAGDIHGRVVERPAGEDALGGLRIRLEVVSEGPPGRSSDRKRGRCEEHYDERRGRPRRAAAR